MAPIAAASGDHYADVTEQTPPATSTVSISYSSPAGEAWDCSQESGTFSALQRPSSLSEAAMQAAFESCEGLGHNWVNCYQDNGGGEDSDVAY